MTRGIHLKHLKATDLELLGLEGDRSSDGSSTAQTARRSLLAEADPALLKIVTGVRCGLEETLSFLDQALRRGESGASPASDDES